MGSGGEGGAAEEFADFGVGGLGEVLVPLADRLEPGGREEADDLVGFLGEPLADGRRGDRNSDDDAGGVAQAESGDGGAHGGAGGEAVVDEDDGAAGDVDGRPVAAVGLLAAFELGALAVEDEAELVGGGAGMEDGGFVDELDCGTADAAGGDGSEGELGDVGGADFANYPYIEGGVEGLGDFEGDGDAATGESEDAEVGLVGEGGELGG